MKIPLYLVSLTLIFNIAIADTRNANLPVLVVKPQKCVALRKGQVCYQKLKVSFNAAEQGDYCLHLNDDKKPLRCWSDATEGNMAYVFESDQSGQFKLFEKSGRLMASSQVTVAWVYSNRSRRRSAWRLF